MLEVDWIFDVAESRHRVSPCRSTRRGLRIG
jgi:hypothetical protein